MSFIKENKLNWHIFNLLENLLIFCAVPSRRAPQESGVSFYITNPQDDAICLLFQIDRDDKRDPLIRAEKIKRPDYLSLFIQNNLLIFTIIEMKGTHEDSTEHGIEQITTFKDILRTAINKCFSKKLKIKLQCILLTPYNASIPLPEIQKQASNDFIILPIQYNQKAELYDYISKVNTKRDLVSKSSYIYQKKVESKRFLIEKLLAERGFHKRNEDKYYSENYVPSQDTRGVYIDYLLPNDEDWITLLSDPNQKKIQLALSEQEYQETIQKELEILKLTEIINIVLSRWVDLNVK